MLFHDSDQVLFNFRPHGDTLLVIISFFRLIFPNYQAISLPAWSGNETKRLVKTPKIHYLDNGVIQAVLQKRGGITGNEFESLVIAEIYKQVQTTLAPLPFFHLRTQDGREVDLLVELPDGYLAFEIKMAENVGKQDAKHLVKLEQFLDKPLLHAFVLSKDLQTKSLEEGIIAVNATYFLG